MPFVAEFITIIILLILNGIFAAYEMALASISFARIHVLVEQNRKGAKDAAFMKSNMEGSLAVIQLGITLVGASAAAIGGAGVDELLVPVFIHLGVPVIWSEVLAFMCLIVPLSAFTIIFAELAPKTFALKNKELICLQFSPIMRLLSVIFSPAVAFFEHSVKIIISFGNKQLAKTATADQEGTLHELRAATSLARSSRLLGARQEKIVLAAAQLSFRSIAEIMIPLNDICTIPLKASLMDAFLRAHMDMHTRFPVCEDGENLQTITGYVNFKDILVALKINPNMPNIQGIMRPIKSFGATNTIVHVLEGLIGDKTHIAVIRDGESKIVGLITLEDIIEEMTGDIEDEFDKLPAQIYAYGDSWVVGGGIKMDALAAQLNLNDTYPSTPLSQWCYQQHPQDFKGGESFNIGKLNILVRKLKRKQIAEALITKVN